MDNLHALQPGYMLDKFEIKKFLGEGGFGLTYLAYDTEIEREVAIKEYYPSDFSVRENNTNVKPKATNAEGDFRWGLERFLDEAKTLAKFKNPHIVSIIDYIKKNGTAYIVMEFFKNGSLEDKFSEYKKSRKSDTDQFMPEEEVKTLLLQICKGLSCAHQKGVIHRDISPSNIMFSDVGLPVLIDFGAAKYEFSERTRSVHSAATPGFSPIEQYSRKSQVGAYTDIYSLAAVAFTCLKGEKPIEAIDRFEDDELEHLAKKRSASVFLQRLDWGLELKSSDRPQDLDEWIESWGEDEVHEKKSRKPSSEVKVEQPKEDEPSEVPPVTPQPKPVNPLPKIEDSNAETHISVDTNSDKISSNIKPVLKTILSIVVLFGVAWHFKWIEVNVDVITKTVTSQLQQMLSDGQKAEVELKDRQNVVGSSSSYRELEKNLEQTSENESRSDENLQAEESEQTSEKSQLGEQDIKPDEPNVDIAQLNEQAELLKDAALEKDQEATKQIAKTAPTEGDKSQASLQQQDSSQQPSDIEQQVEVAKLEDSQIEQNEPNVDEQISSAEELTISEVSNELNTPSELTEQTGQDVATTALKNTALAEPENQPIQTENAKESKQAELDVVDIAEKPDVIPVDTTTKVLSERVFSVDFYHRIFIENASDTQLAVTATVKPRGKDDVELGEIAQAQGGQLIEISKQLAQRIDDNGLNDQKVIVSLTVNRQIELDYFDELTIVKKTHEINRTKPYRVVKNSEFNIPDIYSLPRIQLSLEITEEDIRLIQNNTAEAYGITVAFSDFIQDENAGPVMVVIPAGRFRMGCSFHDGSCLENELVTDIVTHTKPFSISETEITIRHWLRCVKDGGCPKHSVRFNAYLAHPEQPVRNINLSEINQYLAWLSSKTGETYRLPSESEWEYAARSGTITKYYWGNEPSCEHSNFNYGTELNATSRCKNYAATKLVGSYLPNNFGLFDMLGNVEELMSDRVLNDDGTAIGSNNDCQFQHVRGGSWVDWPQDIRVSKRNYVCSNKEGNFGFRVVREL